MCGVIGYAGPSNPSLISKIFLENNIRGQHATGISWIMEGVVHTFSQPGSASEFLKSVPECALSASVLIGHSRYSTSSLSFNQPISNKFMSVVHNGVITQESPETWLSSWGFKCEGENDTELILCAMMSRSDENNLSHPLSIFPDASMACCVLDHKGSLRFFRNGKRPLWKYTDDKMIVVSSSKSILSRSMTISDTARLESCEPFCEYLYSSEGSLTQFRIEPDHHIEDWQKHV